MGDFGHVGIVGAGWCVDSWGAGPFVIDAKGKRYRFEDSDMFGPALVDRRGDPLKNPWPNERSPFWTAHAAWRKAGRRVAADGKTCIYEWPKPTVVRAVNRQITIIEKGDEDLAGYVDEQGKAIRFTDAPATRKRRR